jgi:hypothetical protein
MHSVCINEPIKKSEIIKHGGQSCVKRRKESYQSEKKD